MRTDEFYIGYIPKAPAGVAKFRARIAIALALAVPAVAAAIAFAQRPQPDGVFEFGVAREFEGVLYETPVPMLHLERPLEFPGAPAVSDLLLVNAGKFGLPAYARGREGSRVRFKGSLIHNDALAMIEMNDAQSFTVLGPPSEAEERGNVEGLDRVKLIGELVDSKCYLGVMRPGAGKVHRACAVRCLSGGVPPALLVRGADADYAIVLAGADGLPMTYDPAWAGRIVSVEGRLNRFGDFQAIYVEWLKLYRRTPIH